jgi:multidrug efflux pump subunit AcrA (membrane-fusion protein)
MGCRVRVIYLYQNRFQEVMIPMMEPGKKTEQRRRPVRVILGMSVLVFASTIFLSCLPGGGSSKDGASSGSSSGPAGELPAGEKIFYVRAAEVTVGDMENIISMSGEVYATGRVNVVPEINGLLTKVLVSPGDRVSAGEIIAYVDPSKPGMSFAESPVRSKTSGTVTAVPAVSGNQVSVQSVIAQVGHLDRLEIEIKVPERYLAYLKTGMPARVTSRAYPDDEQTAGVTEVSPVVDPRSRTVLVTLVPDSTEKLRPGQAVNVNLILETKKESLMVSSSALTERRDGKGVFIAEEEKAVWRPVVTGFNDAGSIEVLEGLNPGDSVIVAGFEDLTDGSSIRVQE